MGMRNGLAYEDKSGVITTTYVQWSTAIDDSLGEALKHTSANKSNFMRRVFKEITRHSAISSIDTSPVSKFDNKDSYTIKDTCLTIHNPLDDDVRDIYEGVDAFQSMLRDYSEDGLGAMFSEKRPDVITFFFTDYDNNTHVESIKLDDLCNNARVDGYRSKSLS